MQAAAIALALAALMGEAAAETGDTDKGVFGVGLIIGEPTGVSAKYYLGNDTAVDGAIGFAPIGNGVQVHADFLWHPWILEQQESFVLPLYIGIGGRVLDRNGRGDDEDHIRIGARGVVGILFDFTSVPIDVFAELAGIVDLRTKGDAVGVDINAGAGVRYYF